MTPSTSATEEALECRRTNAVRHGGVVTGQSSMCSGAFGVCSDGALQCLVRLVKNRRSLSSLLLYTPTTWQKLRSVRAYIYLGARARAGVIFWHLEKSFIRKGLHHPEPRTRLPTFPAGGRISHRTRSALYSY